MLPKLNDVPKYEIEIPSTGDTKKFRPFLVKEEKILLLAMESENATEMLAAIVDTIGACVQDIDTEKLTAFDVEFLFMKVRAKSVGETAQIKINCSECEEPNDYEVNIDQLKMDVPDLDPIIKLDENISIEMQWPSWKDLQTIMANAGESNEVAYMFALLRAALKSVMTEDERIDLRDTSADEIDEFVDSMNTAQLNMIREYVDKMPALTEQVKFKCENCSHENDREIRGLQSFFS